MDPLNGFSIVVYVYGPMPLHERKLSSYNHLAFGGYYSGHRS
jgi:hypothetical protein